MGRGSAPSPPAAPPLWGHRREWQLAAACRDVPNPDIFFPAKGGGTSKAKAICAGCPVQLPCRLLADELEALESIGVWGVWGGESPEERVARRRRDGGARLTSV